MPTYEYVCGACKHHWEAFQSIKEDALTECPKCGKPKARRQISAGTGFILKGGGWYSDLYASPKADKAESKPSEAASSESAKSDGGKSDSAKSDKTESTPSDTSKSDTSKGKDKKKKTSSTSK